LRDAGTEYLYHISFIVSLSTIALPKRERASAEISRYTVVLRETIKGTSCIINMRYASKVAVVIYICFALNLLIQPQLQ